MAEAFPISGNIDPTTFPFLLADLHRQGATGSLRVEGPSYPKALYFRSGRVLFGSSNDPKDQLGAILIESGKISPEQLEEVNTKVGPGNPLAKVLAESGFVNQRELSESARVKVERILSDVISYSAGNFEFEDGVLPKGAVDLKLSTEKLVLAAVSRLGDRGFVLRHLDSLGVVLRPASDMGERMGELRPEAGDLPERLDGKRSLKEAASLTRLDEFEAAKVACALLFLGLVEKAPPAAGDEMDLGQTARMAFDDVKAVAEDEAAPTAPEPDPEPAFFVPEAEAAEVPAFDVTMPDAPVPRFGDSETPPLGVSMTPPPPPMRASPPEPGPEAGFSLSEPAPAPSAPPASFPVFAFSAPDEGRATPRNTSPPQTDAFDRPPLELPEPPPPPPALAFEDEHRREAPAPPRPSKEDLAALDALLNPSASARTAAAPAPRPRHEKWEPQFRPGTTAPAPRGRNRRRPALPIVPIAAAVALVLAAGGGAWYFFGRSAKAPAGKKAVPPPSLTIIEATPSPGVSPETTMTAANRTPIPAPPSTVAAAPATLAPATTPPAPPATAPPATAPPTTLTAAARPAGGGGLAEARQLLERRDYDGAARSFAASVRSSKDARFSVQLLVACSQETVGKALANAGGSDLFILPVSYKGKSCYRMCWGLFDNEGKAESAVALVPAYFREGGARPRVSPTAGLLP